MAAFVLDLLLAVTLGYSVVWTVHNALPHESSRIDRVLRRFLLAIAHPVVHCATARRALGWASRSATVIPHGSYAGWYPETLDREEARSRLGFAPTDRVLLCFGQLRAYKGVEELIRAFHAMPQENLKLVVAGRPASPAEAARLRALQRDVDDERVKLHLDHVPDDEVQVFFKACDLVVLPYLRVLTSGVAVLGLTFGRGLIVPRTGCLVELAQSGCAIGYDPLSPGGLAEALRDAASVDSFDLGRRARRFAETLGWERIAAEYAQLFRDVDSPASDHRMQPASASDLKAVGRTMGNGPL